MEFINTFVIDLFLSVTPNIRIGLIFLLAFGEGMPIVGSFLPGGTIALMIGSLTEENVINPWFAVHLIAIGSLCGDLLGFFIARKLSHIGRIKRIIESEKHASKWDLFDRHAALVIILGKILPVVRSTPALLAGARKMNIVRYTIYVIIGSYLWAIGGIFGGRYLAQFFGGWAIPIILGILVISAALTLLSNKKKKTKKTTLAESEPSTESESKSHG